MCRPMSALITPTSVTAGRSRPFATICVPMSTSASPLRKLREDLLVRVAAVRDVAVPAQRARLRERLVHRLLDPLDAEAHRPQARRRRTSGSARSRRAAAVALVAEQALDLDAVAVEVLVVAQGDGAGGALRHEAAVAALHEAGACRGG